MKAGHYRSESPLEELNRCTVLSLLRPFLAAGLPANRIGDQAAPGVLRPSRFLMSPGVHLLWRQIYFLDGCSQPGSWVIYKTQTKNPESNKVADLCPNTGGIVNTG